MLSIITNFGCDTGCKYCIFMNHPMAKYKTTLDSFDWVQLEYELSYSECTEISVSGGGDPFFRFGDNSEWWLKLLRLCQMYKVKIEVHTSKVVNTIIPFSRYVLHVNYDRFHDNRDAIIELNKTENMRLVFVVTDDITKEFIEFVSEFCAQFNIQLSFRQMVKRDKSISYHLHDYLKTNENWYYIEQCDYNRYFMPNNRIVDKYL